MPAPVLITKSDGSAEAFAPEKLSASLRRAGASSELAARIVSHIEGELTTGMKTSAIYRHAFSFLKKNERVPAIRYSMRKSLLEFGPSGFPFEDFIAELMRARGLSAVTRRVLRGKCVEHEVDVVLEEKGKRSVVEAKFHNLHGIKSDVKVSLYVASRVADLQAGPDGPFEKGWLITNTKFTDRAIQYGRCVGLMLVGWDYPAQGNLHDLIGESGVFPLTALTTLSVREKRALLSKSIVLCRDLGQHEKALAEVGLSERRIAAVLKESALLCGAPHPATIGV